jgi:hypothetical protein
MTVIYVAVTLVILTVVFLVAYLVRGLKFALGTSLAALVLLSIFYAGLVVFATSQMP